MVRVSHLFACGIAFFICDHDRQGGMLKFKKCSFLSIFGRCYPFPQNFEASECNLHSI